MISRRNCSESKICQEKTHERAQTSFVPFFWSRVEHVGRKPKLIGKLHSQPATSVIPQDISLDRRNIRLETRPGGVLMWPYVSNYQRGLWLHVCEGAGSTGVEDVSAGGLLIRAVYLPLQSVIELNGRTSSIDMLVGDFVASNYRHVAAAADKSGSLPAATIVSRNWVTRS